ncbi:ABC transporter substrate-binding protein [Agaribacterium haliotis]|uniref:ABC transporter substrate-binding protein n=1 Tax=Agaribacterium haliotis TaxID=2013869 RepID=UPI0013047096|nr:ABC transporter substrate-binding protein [Agaribacterium haliotis]
MLILVLACANTAAETISIGMQLLRGEQRSEANKQLAKFQAAHPDIELKLQLLSPQAYASGVHLWLTQSHGPDVMLWFGGERLNHYVEAGLIANLSEFWQQHQLDQAFAETIKASVTRRGSIWAIPYSYSNYQLYYFPEQLHKLGIERPRDWKQLLQSCEKLSQQGANMFALGMQTAWSVHGWFDLLNLRINGLHEHKALLSGRLSYESDNIKAVFSHWKTLLDANCFNNNYASLSNIEAFPRLFRGLSAMMLLDFVPAQGIPENKRRQVRSSNFPVINTELANYTVNPVNVFIVPAYRKVDKNLEKVLKFIAGAEFQYALNTPIDRPPARSDHNYPLQPRAAKLERALQQSPGGIQYFDRDTDIHFAEKSPAIFISFLSHRDVDRVCAELEALRQQVFFKPERTTTLAPAPR